MNELIKIFNFTRKKYLNEQLVYQWNEKQLAISNRCIMNNL